MATDTANQLTERFRTIRQDWDLRADESTIQAQNKALAPLHSWLRKGADDPEVVIRAVQVLMADPERPGIHRRPAVNHVFRQLSEAWQSAGMNEQDVHILRGMLLASWPYDLTTGSFELAPLLDSAWMAVRGRRSNKKQLEQWRRQLTIATPTAPVSAQGKPSRGSGLTKSLSEVNAPDVSEAITALPNAGGVQAARTGQQAIAQQAASLISIQNTFLGSIANHLNTTRNIIDQIDASISKISEQSSINTEYITLLADQLDLLWWGQARYSYTLRTPYRRISTTAERLWWMAWECSDITSKLATAQKVAPAASFLVETLYQLDNKADDPKRPLKDWVTDFIDTLRRINENEQHANTMPITWRLKNLVDEDPLGLPVTWARIVATERKPFAGSVEEHLRDQIGLDPETQLDREDWLAWMFRESLLDRHLQDGED